MKNQTTNEVDRSGIRCALKLLKIKSVQNSKREKRFWTKSLNFWCDMATVPSGEVGPFSKPTI